MSTKIILRIESARVWPKVDGSPTPAHRILDLRVTDHDAASQAVTSEQAGAFSPTVAGLAPGGVRILFADVEEVRR